MIKGEKNNIDLSFEDMQFLLALYPEFVSLEPSKSC